ncbi:hypothetical protein DL546_000873 [Coniochaeta pulveracea]|uniref:Uncharacterized protein n=1 Tax=Coniochaeta pulveracea TaxID=177199 RepID=A0A420YMD7_9PEZI|nr:hypothetical protein DL546_000873 [Coniochaeta pulveracea]
MSDREETILCSVSTNPSLTQGRLDAVSSQASPISGTSSQPQPLCGSNNSIDQPRQYCLREAQKSEELVELHIYGHFDMNNLLFPPLLLTTQYRLRGFQYS